MRFYVYDQGLRFFCVHSVESHSNQSELLSTVPAPWGNTSWILSLWFATNDMDRDRLRSIARNVNSQNHLGGSGRRTLEAVNNGCVDYGKRGQDTS